MAIVLQVLTNDFESFFKTPFVIYKDFAHVSILKTDLKRFLSVKNPIFKSVNDFSYFTVIENGHIRGRILAHIHHRSNEKYGLKRCYFGYFDCENSLPVAQLLLKSAENFAKSQGMTELIGNFNMTAMQQIGTIDKILKPYHYTDQVYSPEYISNLLKACGYESTFPMQTHEINLELFDESFLLTDKQIKILNNPDFSFEQVNKKELHKTLENMRQCLNNGFSDNPMFVPLTTEELYFQAKDMMLIVDPEITVVCKHQGQTIGIVVCIPNLNPMLKEMGSVFGLKAPWAFFKYKFFRKESAIIIFYSVFKEFHSQGINAIMLNHLIKSLKKKKYKYLGGTWISLENKASLKQAEKLGAKVMHELSLYKKSI